MLSYSREFNCQVRRITLWDKVLTEAQMSLACDCNPPTKQAACPNTIAFTPPDIGNKYSSTWNDDRTGLGHGRGRLNSPQAWSSKINKVGHWMQIDIGEITSIAGIVTQGRRDYPQWVTSYEVQVSTRLSLFDMNHFGVCWANSIDFLSLCLNPGQRRRRSMERSALWPRVRCEFRQKHEGKKSFRCACEGSLGQNFPTDLVGAIIFLLMAILKSTVEFLTTLSLASFRLWFCYPVLFSLLILSIWISCLQVRAYVDEGRGAYLWEALPERISQLSSSNVVPINYQVMPKFARLESRLSCTSLYSQLS